MCLLKSLQHLALRRVFQVVIVRVAAVIEVPYATPYLSLTNTARQKEFLVALRLKHASCGMYTYTNVRNYIRLILWLYLWTDFQEILIGASGRIPDHADKFLKRPSWLHSSYAGRHVTIGSGRVTIRTEVSTR